MDSWIVDLMGEEPAAWSRHHSNIPLFHTSIFLAIGGLPRTCTCWPHASASIRVRAGSFTVKVCNPMGSGGRKLSPPPAAFSISDNLHGN